MPGSSFEPVEPHRAASEPGSHGWDGKEPPSVVIARALAPWPLWLLLWEHLGVGRHALAPAGSALIVALMAQRAARAAGRPIPIERVVGLVATALGVTLVLRVLLAFTWYGRGFAPTGSGVVALLCWIGCAVGYELAKRTLDHAPDGPTREHARLIDVASHALLFAGPWIGLVDLSGDGLPAPLLVGPLVSLRLVAAHDAPVAPARGPTLATHTVLGIAAAVVLLGAALEARHAVSAPGAIAWTVLGAGVTSLVAAVALAGRASVASRSLSGRVAEVLDGAVILSRSETGERVRVVPREPSPGGCLPPAGRTVTFLDVEPVAHCAPPYRGAPATVRARLGLVGSPPEIASGLLVRAWGWLAFSALTFAAGTYLLG